jgi:hypothetical protein
MNSTYRLLLSIMLVLSLSALNAFAQDRGFQLTSTMFANDGVLPGVSILERQLTLDRSIV